MTRRNAPPARSSHAVGYVRRSTDKQEQSIEDQKKALQTYAAEHGLRLSKFYIDDAISGTSTLGRRAFQQMMSDAQSDAKCFDIIVVYDVKRFGRVDNDDVPTASRSATSVRTSMATPPTICYGRSSNGKPGRNPRIYPRLQSEACSRRSKRAPGWAGHPPTATICVT